MIYNIYVIFDKVAGIYGAPNVFASQGLAIRWFKSSLLMNEEMSVISGDLDLYFIGTFDSKTAEVCLQEKPVFVINGSDLMAEG